VLIPRDANPYQDDAQRTKNVENQLEADSPRHSLTLVIGGCAALVAFGVLWLVGLSWTGVLLVPIGLGLILGGGIPLILNHL
jgi:hypothetical protein